MQIDIAGLEAEVDQMWAEAYQAYLAMRKAQPKGRLPLFLTDSQAAAEALEMQESRRIEGAEDGMAGLIQHWLDTPVEEHEFQDVDDMTNDTKKLWQRNEVSLLQIWIECLGRGRDQYNDASARLIGRAMKIIRGWSPGGARRTPYGMQKVYRRDDAIGGALYLIETKQTFDDLF